jgi:hypothetical protein
MNKMTLTVGNRVVAEAYRSVGLQGVCDPATMIAVHVGDTTTLIDVDTLRMMEWEEGKKESRDKSTLLWKRDERFASPKLRTLKFTVEQPDGTTEGRTVPLDRWDTFSAAVQEYDKGFECYTCKKADDVEEEE